MQTYSRADFKHLHAKDRERSGFGDVEGATLGANCAFPMFIE